MDNDIKTLLNQYAKLKVFDKQYWELVFGKGGDESLKPAYLDFAKYLSVAYQNILASLKELGHPVQEYTITGQAPNGIGHYDIDDAIKAEFDDEVIVDSEHSQLFIYTTERVKDEVYARVLELAGTGMVTLNSGDTYPSSFSLEQDDELQVAGIGSWSSAEKWLLENT